MCFTLGQSQTPAAGPATPPARNTWDALSQYGNTYANQSGVIFDSFGGSNIVGDITLGDGSIVKKYLSHSYSGIKVNGLGDLNVTSMTHLHLDVWSPDFVSFKIKLEGTNGSNNEIEVPFAKNQGSWNSYDLDLSTYTGVTLANLRWIVPVTFNPNNTTLFITNVYFYRPATSMPPSTITGFSIPNQPVNVADFAITPPTSNSSGVFSYTSSNTNVAMIVGGTNIHIVSGGTTLIAVNQAADGSYGAGSAVTTFTASYPAPGASPVPPVRTSGSVVSMFTGSPSVYSDPVAYNMVRAPWSGATMTTVPNGSNTCLQVDNFGYLGYVTDQEPVRYSVAGMTKLHVDIYLNSAISNMFIVLLSNGDKFYNSGALAAGWNSLDIPLTEYTNNGADLSNIYGFKFEQNVSSPIQIYLDNIYFYVAGTDPTLTAFTMPTKVFGDADFAITAPTSNSLGAFTYTSSNASVATIVNGNEIHLVSNGTTTIKAIQAADGIFDSGSITASLVVAAPPLTIAAPIPPIRNTWDVVSLYSNAYANVPSVSWANAASTTDEVLQGNDTKKMSNFIVEFINFAPTDVSAMTMLHMDIYTPDCPGFNIWLLNNGDRNAQIFPAVNGWRSIDIPLSTYTNNGLIMTAISSLKFESLSGPGKTVYVDNVYFYRPDTLFPPTVGTFSVSPKNFGDADFALTPPTSNNTSIFTYTSSNPSVATLIGNMVHIVSGGTSIITASQVSDGTYGPSIKTANFVINFPTPGASPIPPVRDPLKVISMYTGTPSVYANNPTYNTVRSYWTGATTMTEVANGTNTALRVDNLGFIGLIDQSERRLNVTGMTNLHIDVYLNTPLSSNPALSRLFIFLLAPGDNFHEEANLVAGWNSLNINLSQYPGANLSDIYGLKLEQNSSAPMQLYLDNIYFSDESVIYYADADGDGYGNLLVPSLPLTTGQPVGYVTNSTDCNDANANVNPGKIEIAYNGIDDNCDGMIDEGFPVLVTTLTGTTCGAIMANNYLAVHATQVAGATGYRFKVTNMASGSVQIIDRTPYFWFQFNTVTDLTYGTNYKIEVMLQKAGIWLGYYGTPCTVTTPSISGNGPGSASLVASQCGSTLSSISQTFGSNSLPGATGYRFRLTNIMDASVQVLDRTVQWVSLNMFPVFNYGASYTVEVAVKTTGTSYSAYGGICTITAPAVPALQFVCGTTIAKSYTNFGTKSSIAVTNYKFEVTNTVTNDVQTLIKTVQYLSFRELTGIVPSTVYSFRVAVKTGNTYSAFSTACLVTSPAASKEINGQDATPSSISEDFKVLALPNPFDYAFALDLKSNLDSKVEVKVYDMIGKLIETREIEFLEINNISIGENYPSGVYNVIVNQGDNLKTLRIIKR